MAIAVCAWAPLGAQQHQPAGPPDHMQHKFDDPAKFAKQFDDPKRDEWQMPSRVIAALGLKSGMAVADIGAGYFSMRLARVSPGLSVYSVDIEPKMVEHLTHRAAGRVSLHHRADRVGNEAALTSRSISTPWSWWRRRRANYRSSGAWSMSPTPEGLG